MSYEETILDLSGDAEQLELTFQAAVKAGQAEAFGQAIDASYAQDPGNLLYAAWHYRLAYAVAQVKERVIAWNWAIPLAIITGLLYWWLSADRFTLRVINPVTGLSRNVLPAVVLLAAPIGVAAVGLFLTLAGRRRWDLLLVAVLGVAGTTAYVLLLFPQMGPQVFQEQYLTLMAMHLALLAWGGLGLMVLARRDGPDNRFAFLAKSLEVFVMAGLFAIAGGIFTSITFGLFAALGIEPPDLVIRLFVAGGAGLLLVLAIAIIYDPSTEPQQQAFNEGLNKLLATLTRILLPLALLVLVTYLAFIPFNFREPFENRDVLVAFNAMLFAIIALLAGATPVLESELSRRIQTWLRRGIVALAALALLVSLYALAAILYRTAIDRLTPNRLAVIGWNLVNIAILAWLLVRQWREGRNRWLPGLKGAFATGITLYIAWALVMVLALPWLFRFNRQEVSHLPFSIQRMVYEEPYPILLKCTSSPHIYLLEDGTKRWIQDIPTFEAEGYVWRDVKWAPCADLRAVPDGSPIPPDAGPPPQP